MRRMRKIKLDNNFQKNREIKENSKSFYSFTIADLTRKIKYDW